MTSIALERLCALRQHQQDGKRSPHKPLLVLLALGRLSATGSSSLRWESTVDPLAELISEFGPPSLTGKRQSAAYPFTRLRTDGVWELDHDVPMDRVTPLDENGVTGRLSSALETALADRTALHSAARAVAESEFPPSLVPDVLTAVGLQPDIVYGPPVQIDDRRKRSVNWPGRVLLAWDRRCSFCGFDGQLGSGVVGIEAAHIRWFNFDGPDELDNGLALCSLHHKLFDRGAIGLSGDYRIRVSAHYTARTDAGRMVYELADRELEPRPGTPLPAHQHLQWHAEQVFKGEPLLA